MHYIVELLSAAVRNAPPPEPPEKINYNELTGLAVRQHIHTLIFPAISELKRNGAGISGDIFALYQKAVAGYVAFFIRECAVFEKVLNALEDSRITAVLTKGYVIKDCYPFPELRKMVDFDLIVSERGRGALISCLKNCGYNLPKQFYNAEVLTFTKSRAFSIDVTVVPDDSPYIGNTVPFRDLQYLKTLAPAYHAIYLLEHLMKHLQFKGAGVRNLADIYLLFSKCEIDYIRFYDELENRKLTKLFGGIREIIKEDFDLAIPGDRRIKNAEHLPALLLNNLLRDGIFGNEQISSTARRAAMKKESRLKTFLKIIFPPPKELMNRYSYARAFPPLLPAAWFHRLFSAIFSRRGREVIRYRNSKQFLDDRELFELLN